MSAAAPGAPEQDVLALCKRALRLVCAGLPHLSGLAHVVRLKATRQVPVAAVTASGLVAVNPDRFAALPLGDAAYILAHELLHLALDSHSRGEGSDPLIVNFAHDYIINDILTQELGRHPPLGGLDWPGSRERSLEQLIVDLSGRTEGPGEGRCWNPDAPAGGPRSRRGRPPAPSPLSRALRDAGLLPPESEPEPEPPPDQTSGPPDDDPLSRGDLIPPEREDEFEPELSPEQRRHRQEQVRREATKAASLGALGGKLDAIDRPSDEYQEPERGEGMMDAVRGAYHTPWELALQHWMDAVAPGPRTFSRPSRRGADRTDCVLPGRKREGWTLHIVLDTSGSMVEILPRALGAIASFCEGSGISETHVLQCDVEVTRDEWVAPEDLAHYRIAGFGGSNMAPGLTRLAEDPEVAAALVLTDGYIDYPSQEPPFHVLWALIGDYSTAFNPPYGTIIHVRL